MANTPDATAARTAIVPIKYRIQTLRYLFCFVGTFALPSSEGGRSKSRIASSLTGRSRQRLVEISRAAAIAIAVREAIPGFRFCELIGMFIG
jgi:hypothetical protein